MRVSILAPIAMVLGLAACAEEPSMYEGPELDAEAAALILKGSLTLKEGYCNDGKDNDGDGLVDQADSDCNTGAGVPNGFSGTIATGTDLWPGDSWYTTIDGTGVYIDAYVDGLSVRNARTGALIATVDTQSGPSWVGVGQVGSGGFLRANPQELMVKTRGGGAGYAPGTVGGAYYLNDPVASSGSGGPIGGGGSGCTLSCP